MASRLLSTTLITPPANLNKSSSGLTARVRLRKGRLSIRAVSGSSQGGSVDGTVYKGVYGPWSVEQSDVKEVRLFHTSYTSNWVP